MKGFFQVTRQIFQQATWERPFDFRLFVWILGNACFKEMEWQGMKLKKGQWVRSLRKLAEDLTYKENNRKRKPSHSQIERAIQRMVKEGVLTQEKCEHGLLFTVTNYENMTKEHGNGLGNDLGNGLGNTFENAESVGTQGVQELEQRDLGTEHGNGACVEHGTRRIMDIKNNGYKEQHHEEEQAQKQVNMFDKFYLSYGKQPTPIQIQKMSDWIDKDGLTQDLVVWAIEEGAKRSGSFDYLDAILRNCRKENVMTVEQALQKKEQKQKRKVKQSEGHETSNFRNNGTIDHEKHNFGF